MTLTQLKYIIALDDYKNFAVAAEHCFVAQPTLSLQVKKLEQSLNIELFDRTKTPLVTTSEGKEFLMQARQVMHEVEKLTQLTTSYQDVTSATLKIALIPTIACYLMAPLVEKMAEKYPGINLWVKELPTNQIIEQVEQNKIDLGIVALPLNQKQLNEHVLYYEPLVVHGSHNVKLPKSLSMDALKDYPVILLGDDHCFRNQSMKICSHAANSQAECYSLETLQDLVKVKNAATLLPQRYAEIKDLATVAFKKPKPARSVGWVAKKNFINPRMTALVEDMIKELMPSPYYSRKDKKILGIELNG